MAIVQDTVLMEAGPVKGTTGPGTLRAMGGAQNLCDRMGTPLFAAPLKR